MNDGITFRINGLRELKQKFDALDKKTRRSISRKSLRAGATIITRGVRNAAPRRTGLLRRSIRSTLKSYGGGARFVAIIGQQKDIRFGKATERAKSHKRGAGISGRGDKVPIHLVDQRVGPHDIPELPGVLLIGERSGVRTFVSNVYHPGHPGINFVRKGFRTSKRAAIIAITSKFSSEITAAAGKR